MKKFILGTVIALSILVAPPVMADHDDYRHGGDYGHRGGGGDGWKWLGGAIIGGMIVDQIDRNRYAPPPIYVQPPYGAYPPPYAAPPPMRRVMRCANFVVTDQWGNEFIQQRCYYELVPLQ